MNLILRQVIGYQQGLRKAAPSTADPKLKKELKDTKKDLKSILNKWKFGEESLTTADQFLAKFEPWINSQLEKQKEWKVFLAKHGSKSLAELADYITNLGTGETATPNPELANFLAQYGAASLEQIKETWQNTEADYLNQIQTLKESRGAVPEDYEALETEIQNLKTQLETYAKGEDWETQTGKIITELEKEVKELQEQLAKTPEGDWETERDQLTREKKELEQETLALNNRLKNKSEEVTKKLTEIELLKKEKNTSEIALNKTITELREKHRKREKLLDEEQCENNKLNEKIEQLEAKIEELRAEIKNLLKEKHGDGYADF